MSVCLNGDRSNLVIDKFIFILWKCIDNVGIYNPCWINIWIPIRLYSLVVAITKKITVLTSHYRQRSISSIQREDFIKWLIRMKHLFSCPLFLFDMIYVFTLHILERLVHYITIDNSIQWCFIERLIWALIRQFLEWIPVTLGFTYIK